MKYREQQIRFILQPASNENTYLKLIIRHNLSDDSPVDITHQHNSMNELNLDEDSYSTMNDALNALKLFCKQAGLDIESYDLVKLERSGWRETARQRVQA